MSRDDTGAPGRARVHFSMQVGEGGIAWLRIGSRDSEAVLLGLEGLRELELLIAELEPLIAGGQVLALVLTGEQPGMFVAGTDVDELRLLPDAATATEWAIEGQRVLRRLEELPIPTIAAIDGPCLEAGLELALACAYRLASDSPATRLGLPQVRLGLIPSFGGTVRLPRLVGIQASLELILKGQSIGPERALQLALIDEVLPLRQFPSAVERFAEARIQRGRIRTGARRRIPRRLLEDTAPGRRLVFRTAARRLAAATEQPSPAAERALRTVSQGVALPLERAFQQEAAVAGELVTSEHAQALLHALRLLRDARRGASQPADHPIERAGVLGAGSVGSEVAYLLTAGHLPVLLKDRRRDALLRGVQHVHNLLRRDETEGGLTTRDLHRRSDLVATASGFGGFGTLDLVLAAVGHQPDSTVNALREVEEHTRPDCVLAVTSFSVSPSRVQQEVQLPERVIGLRFSRPADLFSLVELVPGQLTEQRTIDTCLDLARRLGRAAIVAPDVIQTPGTRLLGICFAESLRLLEEGATVTEIDRAAEAFGITLGPFRRMDAIGVDRCVRLLHQLAEVCGPRMTPSPIVRRLSGSPALFYRYQKGLPRSPNAGLPAGIPAPENGFAELIQHRLVLLLINEAAMALQQHPSLRPHDLDVAAIAGLGFPRSRGGVLYHAERFGPVRLEKLMREYAARFGDRFAPAPLLQELAKEGRGFYGAASGQGVTSVLR